MVDISHLGSLNSTTELDLSTYTPDESKPKFTLPPAGVYTVRAPESFPAEAFGKSQAGFLTAQVDPTIVGGPFDNTPIKFTRVSAKTWTTKTGKEISMAALYLKANGRQTVPTDPVELANAIASTANNTYQVQVDWRGKNKATGEEIKGMERFPLDADGNRQPFIELDEVDDQGRKRRIWANLEVVRFLS